MIVEPRLRESLDHMNAPYCVGPGTFREILAHPADPINKAIERWVGFKYRFAFFYWVRWYKSMQKRGQTGSNLVLIWIVGFGQWCAIASLRFSPNDSIIE